MSYCNPELKKTVPLHRVVAAAIVDTYQDIGRVQQMYSHWAARELKKIIRETLKTGIRRVTIDINKNTRTGTLPVDFDYESFVGVVVNGKKIRLKINQNLVDEKNIVDIPCEDKCEKCKQDKSICNDLTVTEDTTLVVINDTTYEQTVIKKLYPDGRYWLETKIPILDIESGNVIFTTKKEFITELSLKPCGCIEDTEANIEKIKCCCYDAYCQYYAPCDNTCSGDYGGYRIFEETGLIQLDSDKVSKLYLEYYGFLVKKNGQYHVPEVAFETIVEGVKYRSIKNKKNVTNVMVNEWYNNYVRERKNMNKVIGRISLSMIIQSIGLIPKFDVGDDYEYFLPETGYVQAASNTSATTNATESCDANTPAVCQPVVKGFTPFQIAVIAGMGTGSPIVGENTYQHDALKGAVNLNMIIVNNSNETILAQQFSFDSVSGTISRWQGDGITPNPWQGPPDNQGDVLIINFSKLV